jgi:metabolite-proton symporter
VDAASTITPEAEQGQIRTALAASAIGTSIEWYDFFLYGTMAALVFPDLFFPEVSRYAGTLAAFGTYAVGFAARPLGAAIFGHVGDRLGRKNALIATLVLMGTASFAIGVLPTYAAIGIWAPALLVALRILQGIGVGGEWGGSVLIALERAGTGRRGLVGSVPQLGVPIGLLLANAAVFVCHRASGDAWERWGWRIPFLLSFVLILVGLWIRLSIRETPIFEELRRSRTTARRPVSAAFRRSYREVALTALIRLSEQTPFYVFTAFVLAYGTDELGYSEELLLAGVLTAAALALVTIPLFGHASDRYGRKRIYMLGALLTLVWVFPYFALLQTSVALLAFGAIAISLIPHDMQYGPQAALIAEAFPTQIRYSGAGLGYQLASLVAGGPAPLVATWLLHEYGPYAVATYLALSAAVSLAALSRLPERSRVELEALDAAPEAHEPGARSGPVKPHRPLRASGPATRRRVRSRGSASSSPGTPPR